ISGLGSQATLGHFGVAAAPIPSYAAVLWDIPKDGSDCFVHADILTAGRPIKTAEGGGGLPPDPGGTGLEPTPEPAAWLIGILGVGGLGACRLRSQGRRQSLPVA